MVLYFDGVGFKVIIANPFNGKTAAHGDGAMLALNSPYPEKVREAYVIAVELGAADEGKSDKRYGGEIYGSYFIDLAGYKFCLYYVLSQCRYLFPLITVVWED